MQISIQDQLNNPRSNATQTQMPTQSQLNQQQLQQIKNLMSMVQMSSDPQTALLNIINQNPNLRNIVMLAKSNGSNLEQVFYALAQQRGVNPNDVLNALRS